MVIGNPKTDSEKFLARVKKILEEASAANLKVERMGKKLLAYPIAKQTEGEYLLFNFEAEPQAVFEISSALRLEQEQVLRYLLVRVPKVAKVSKGTEEPREPEEVEKITVKTVVSGAKKEKAKVKTKKEKSNRTAKQTKKKK